MAALKQSRHGGRVVWLGRVTDRDETLRAAALQVARLDWAGIDGEAHGGRTRPACSRVSALHPEGTEIANTRQLSVLSAEELAETAAAMGLDALDPALVGASLVVEGLPDLTHLPPSSRLQGPDGVTLVVDMENRACHYPGREIDAEAPGFGARYKAAATGRRGITAWVERPGTLRLGDPLRLFIPDQRAWAPRETVTAG